MKDSSRWVIFPRLSVKNHALIEKRNAALSDVFSEYPRNVIIREKECAAAAAGSFDGAAGTASSGTERCMKGIATQGANYGYVLDSMGDRNVRVMRVATPFPFPEKLALEFLEGLDEVLCVEELDPVIERALTYVCGKYGLKVKIRGKKTGDLPLSGENTLEIVDASIAGFLNEGAQAGTSEAGLAGAMQPPALPVRPPVLCAGCPHRASFYAVKVAMKGQKTIYCGDIGCYTLGNAQPLDMCDTCLCMGAGISIAQGVYHTEPDTKCFAFVGDSTFFASGITETINAFYNQADMTLVILDNSTTAMTGHRPHPGTGRTVMGQVVEKVSMEKVLRAIGLTVVETVDPLDYQLSVETVKRVAKEPGVKAIIFRSPCIALTKLAGHSAVDPEKCIACGKCIRELGCPALILDADGKKAKVDISLCTGCTLCEQLCPVGAISGGRKNDTAPKTEKATASEPVKAMANEPVKAMEGGKEHA